MTLSKDDLRGYAPKLDAILILDEAGEFLGSRSQANEWLAYLRKLNVVLLLPSVRPPASDVRFLNVGRTMNWNVIGVPCWTYAGHLDGVGGVDEKFTFYWWFPSEIYGIYDTDGFPSDADTLLNFPKTMTAQAAKVLGYDNTARKNSIYEQSTDASGRTIAEQVSSVVDVEGAIDHLEQAAKKVSESVSVLDKRQKKRR